MSRKSTVFSIILVFLTVAWWVFDLKKFYFPTLDFDDAYMFWRYALHLRAGLGWSWNLDGVHTYGQTSLLWGAAVWLLTFFPTSMSHSLMLGSWLTSGAALLAMSHAISRNARSEVFSRTWHVIPWIALPIIISRPFLFNASTGMDTMLAMLTNAVFVGMTLAWSSGRLRGEWVGLMGGLCFLARPESGIAVVLMPALAWWLGHHVTRTGLARVFAVFFAIVALDLIFAKLYFHTPLPLGFYMKSRHAYEGYWARWNPVASAMEFFSACGIFLIAIVMFARKKDLRLIIICMTPAVVTFLYLFTVTQIMGFRARYYVPYFAFFAIPALLLLDERLAKRERDSSAANPTDAPLMRYAFAGLVLYFVLAMYPQQLLARVDRIFEGRKFAYDDASLTVSATRPLPMQDSIQALDDVAEILVKPLPGGATVAASEVGYIGALAPRVNVIDLAGLNDTQIALQGFEPAQFLARKPDLIWFPHVQYTYQRGLLFSDPTLLRDYVVIENMGFYGLAYRKDSPYHALLEASLDAYWKKRYPGYTMSDYIVRAVSWDRKKHEMDTP